MSSAVTLHGADVHAGHDAHEHHHHHETFITKYVFSQDHKMIARQFLITGIIWAIIGGFFSVVFRLQLGYPDTAFPGWKISSVIGLRAVNCNPNSIMPW